MYYTYLSYESFSNRKYIGYAKLKSKYDLPIQDPYKGSYSDKTFNPDKKIILTIHASRKEAMDMEVILQKRNNVLKDPNFINRFIYENGFHLENHTEETKLKMSKSHMGRKKSIEHRENIRKARIGDKNPMYGKEGANKGKKFDDNWRKKLSEAKNPNRYDFINTLTQEIAYNKSASEMMNEKQISKSEIYRLINKKKKILKSGWALHDNQQ